MPIRSRRGRPGAGGALAAVVLVLALVAGGPAAAASQERSAEVRAYLRSVAAHYEQDPAEVRVLVQGARSPAELPVALLVSRRAGISAEAVLALRRSGRSWADILVTYGLDAGAIHVPLREPPTRGALGEAYAAYGRRDRPAWPVIRLSDDAVVHLVHLGFLSRYLELPADRVAAALVESGSPVEAYRDLLRPRIP